MSLNTEPTNIHHTSLISYLHKMGWKDLDKKSQYVSYFSKNNRMIDVLTKEDIPTYPFEIDHSLKALASIEQRALDEVVRDISRQNIQMLSIAINPGESDHTIAIFDSSKLREAALDLVLSVAHSVDRSSMKIQQWRDFPSSYVKRCREDQSQAGSYIANFIIPNDVIESDRGQKMEGSAVIDKLKSALQRCEQLIERDSLPEPSNFDKEASYGISDRLLKSLNSIGELTSIHTEVQISLAPIRKALIPDICLTIGQEATKYFKDFYEAVDGTSQVTNFSIEGKITNLTIDETESIVAGTVKVRGKGQDDSNPRLYVITLKDENFRKATAEFNRAVSQKEEAKIRAKGTLLKRKRTPQLSDIVTFEIISDK